MSRTRVRMAAWTLYYCTVLVLTAAMSATTAEAHGNGCCLDPCNVPPSYVCQPNTCRTDTNTHNYGDPYCPLGLCRAGTCWWYTDNYDYGKDCEFLCANDDWANCIK
jgi:hypothetical protein